MTSETDGEGRITAYVRDSNNDGFIISIQEPNGAITFYERDNVGHVKIRTHSFDNSTVKDDYNLYGFQTRHEDELQHVTEWVRNEASINGFHNSRVMRRNYPDGTCEEWSDFNQHSQARQHRMRNGAIEYFTFDALGNMETKLDGEDNLTQYSYYSNGLLQTMTDANLHTTSYTYNWRGQVETITYPQTEPNLVPIVTYEYNDGFGNRTAAIDELTHRTESVYDEYNRLKTVTDPLQRVTTYEYGRAPGCSCSYVTTISRITYPSGRVTTFGYDHADRITCKTEGAGTNDAATTTWSYEDVPERVTRIDPREKPWVELYNEKHEKISLEDPNHNTTEWTYWETGEKKTEKRPGPVPNTTYFDYDQANRLSQVTDTNTKTTIFRYNWPDGHVHGDKLYQIEDANHEIYEFDYDNVDRKKSLLYPDSSIEQYFYDAVGNLQYYVNRAGRTRTSMFDERNRETHVAWDDKETPAVDKAYDAAGRLLTMMSWVSELSYTYDEANQLTSETEQVAPNFNPRSVVYSYDDDGRREGLEYPTGSGLVYDYTDRGQLESIYEPVGFVDHLVVEYDYDENGNRKHRSVGSGVEAAYDYDDANRLRSIIHDDVASFAYDYNPVGTRKYVQREDGHGDVYGYDPTDQVTGVRYNVDDPGGAASGGDREVSYDYDPVGNRLSVFDNGSSTAYTPNNLNQYTDVGGDAPEYDGNGNLTAKFRVALTYDAQNRLVSVWKNTVGYEFSYDARNRCARRTRWTRIGQGQWQSTKTNFYYDGWNLVEEQTDKDELIARYVHGAQIDEMVKRTTDAGTFYYHQDALGSTVALTDSSGHVAERYSYDVYGAPTFMDANGDIVPTSACGNRFLFTGRGYLGEIGLYDYRNRFYSPDFGRFLQTDPLRFAPTDVNLYRYVTNAVTRLADPYGLDPTFNQLLYYWLATATVDTQPTEEGKCCPPAKGEGETFLDDDPDGHEAARDALDDLEAGAIPEGCEAAGEPKINVELHRIEVPAGQT